MEIEEAVCERLLTDPALKTLIGTRLYPGQAPQGCSLPYVIYEEAGQMRLRTLSGYVALNRWLMRLDVYGQSRTEAKAVRGAISARLDPKQGGEFDAGGGALTVQGVFHEDQESGTEMPIHAEEAGEHRLGLSLSIWFRANN